MNKIKIRPIMGLKLIPPMNLFFFFLKIKIRPIMGLKFKFDTTTFLGCSD